MPISFPGLMLQLLSEGAMVCVVLLWPLSLMEKGKRFSSYEGDIEHFYDTSDRERDWIDQIVEIFSFKEILSNIVL